MTKSEKITINGRKFEIGYQSDAEFSGYILSMMVNGEYHGVLWTGIIHNEIGFNTDIYATDDDLKAIEEARKILNEKYKH